MGFFSGISNLFYEVSYKFSIHSEQKLRKLASDSRANPRQRKICLMKADLMAISREIAEIGRQKRQFTQNARSELAQIPPSNQEKREEIKRQFTDAWKSLNAQSNELHEQQRKLREELNRYINDSGYFDEEE